jgi:YidC/Oxa1 family membrane protein insertase
MWLLYRLIPSYGFALLLFTLFSRAILIPSSINQQKTSAKMAVLRPQQEEIQKKYAGNQRKLNEEIQALYQREKFNPASGCLPMALQLLLLFGIIDVIYKPLTYILRLSAETVASLTSVATGMGMLTATARAPQLDILRLFFSGSRLGGLLGQGGMASAPLFSSLSVAGMPQFGLIRPVFQMVTAPAAIDQGVLKSLVDFAPGMSFMNINLMQTPSVGMFTDILKGLFSPVILIPILSFATSMIFSLNSMRNMPAAGGQPGGGGMKAMMLLMPVLSLTYTFNFPAGVGLYWTYSNLVGFGQNIIMNKIFNPKEMAEKARQEAEERREKERAERIEAKKRAKELGQDDPAYLKVQASKRLAEARRRDAEKYGEAYEEDQEDNS